MTAAAIATGFGSFAPAPTGKAFPFAGGSAGASLAAGDPLFFATLTLRNVVAGSRYRVTRNDNGDELATGVAAGTGLVNVVISGVPCFSNPMLVDITVRKASASPYYRIADTQAEMTKSGASAFIFQILDE